MAIAIFEGVLDIIRIQNRSFKDVRAKIVYEADFFHTFAIVR